MKRLFTGRRIFWYLLIAVIFVLIFLSFISGKLVEWLWMVQLGYENIFGSYCSLSWDGSP
jgi:uncharacterized membrane protein (UPF0182 family)